MYGMIYSYSLELCKLYRYWTGPHVCSSWS
eukprot:SAG31_NODE_18852_length_620_cov_1.109405_2_plen_29_part_01